MATGTEGQLLQRTGTLDLLIQLRNSGVEIDPRLIRNLTFATDKVDVTGSTVASILSGAVDVSDRAGRLLGIVYGNQGQQVKQTPTNFNTQVELAAGATLYDARQVRALTASDIVTANQGAASATQRWFTNARDDPVWAGVYSFAINDVLGNTVAGYDFVTLFNPVGNTKNLILLQAGVSDYSIKNIGTKNSMYLYRITASSGGTLQAVATINKYDSTFVDPTAEVRTVNPTTTLGAVVAGFPPNYLTGTSTTAAQRKLFVPPTTFTLRPGEGVTLAQAIAGQVDETYDFEIVWAEK